MAKFQKVANLWVSLATLVARGKMSASLGVGSPKPHIKSILKQFPDNAAQIPQTGMWTL
jgi:hypothetical protein